MTTFCLYFFEWLFLSQSDSIICSYYLIFLNFPDLEAYPMPQHLRSRIRPSSIRQRPWSAAEPGVHTRWYKRTLLIDAHVGVGRGGGRRKVRRLSHQNASKVYYKTQKHPPRFSDNPKYPPSKEFSQNFKDTPVFTTTVHLWLYCDAFVEKIFIYQWKLPAVFHLIVFKF